jgi:hypothetical protein
MEFPFETSSRTVGKLLGCPDDGATAIWKDLRERNRIELKNRFDGTDRPSGYGERGFWRNPGSWLNPLNPQ